MAQFCSPADCPPQVVAEYIPPTGSRLRILHRVPEHVTGYDLYCQGCGDEGNKTGFYLVQNVESFNLVPNPTAFNDLYGTSAFNSKVSRVNEWAFDSGFSFRISGSGDTNTTENREYMEIEIPIDTVRKGQFYTASSYIYLPTEWDLQDPRIGSISLVDIVGTDPATASVQEVFSERVTDIQKWTRVAVGKQIRPDADRVVMRVYLRSQPQQELIPPFNATGRRNLAGEYIYADALQLEQGAEATMFFHGDTDLCDGPDKCCEGFRWLGNKHRSASHRPKCVNHGKLKALCDYGLQITEHAGHMAPPVRNINIPYANRPGASYQKTAVDCRTLTFTAYQCARSLEELECEIFGLQNAMMPQVGGCKGRFMLVYHHGRDECIGGCDAEPHDRAACVVYAGGFETSRDSLFRQNLVIQLEMCDPVAWFDYPGHQSQAIPIDKVIQQDRVIKLNSDGTSTGFPVAAGTDVRAVGCLPGTNRVVIGGAFEQGITAGNCAPNLAVYDCNQLCNVSGFSGGAINDIESDGAGNLVIGGSFTAPSRYVGMVYGSSGQTGFFDGFRGGPALAVGAPFWGQVVAGGEGYINFLVDTFNDADRGWRDYVVEGFTRQILDIAIEPNGNVIAVGDFNVIRGSGTPTVPNTNANNLLRIGRFNVNVQGDCLNIANPEWQSLGFGFDGPVRAIEIDPKTGDIFVAGDFQNAIPDAQTVCNIIEGRTTDSRGANQEVIMTQVAGNTYSVELRVSNPVAAQLAAQCISNPAPGTTTPYVRATVTNAGGTTYNFVLPGAPVIGPVANNLTPMTFTLDITQTLPVQCNNLNAVFVSEYDNSRGGIGALAAIPLTNGNGNDNTINSITFQCVGLQTTFQGNNIPVNRVAKITGNTVQPLGLGINANVQSLMIHCQTGELWAGTIGAPTGFTDGLLIWNGQTWNSFPGNLAGRGPVGIRDMKCCPDDCGVVFAMDRDGTSKLYGSAEVDYIGNFEQMDATIHVHGPGRLNHFGHHPCAKMANLCTVLQCGEVASLNTGTAQITSNIGRKLNNSVLAGSRLDFWLTKCDQRMSVYVDNAESTTKATLTYRPHFWGVEGLCCVNRKKEVLKNICCNSRNLVQSREPTENDCSAEGWRTGDLWLDAFGCGRLFVLEDDQCCDRDAQGLLGTNGPITVPTSATVTTPQNLCPPGVNCTGPNPATCPRMEVSYVSPAGGTTQQNQGQLTGLQPAVFDWPIAMNQSTVSYTMVLLQNLSPIPVTITWPTATRMQITPNAPWPNGAKQLTFYQNAVSTDGICRLIDNKVFNFT